MSATSTGNLLVLIDGIEGLAQFLLGFEEFYFESRDPLTEELDLIVL